MNRVYLNGQMLPVEQAHISVLDRGFLLGDGVYEVIPVYGRRPFRLHDHLLRLQSSLDAIRLENPYSQERWRELVEQMVAEQAFEDQWIYLQITRGPGPRDHAFPAEIRPTVFMMANPLSAPPEALRREGVSAITAQDNRWLRCDIKAISLLANVLLRQISADVGAAETILLRDGQMIEGSASTILIVKDGTIRVPPKSNLMLPGITYDVILEICNEHGLPYRMEPVPSEALFSADEIWSASSSKEILPVTRLDDKPVGTGKPGPVYERIYTYYQAYKSREMYGKH